MDECYYCVFWFPTIFHREKKRRRVPEFPVSIGDDDEEKDLFLEIAEELQTPLTTEEVGNENSPKKEKKYDLIFKLTDQKKRSFVTRFCCINQTRNGFVVYSYNRDEMISEFWKRFDVDEQNKFIEKARERVVNRIKMKHHPETEPNPDDDLIKNYTIDRILISFYHHAKQFYHEHETHSQSDAKYYSYYYTEEHEDGRRDYLREVPCLSTKNNPVINWYIDQFEDQLVRNAENISEHYKNWSKNFEDIFTLKARVDNALAGNSSEEISKLIAEIQRRNEIASLLEIIKGNGK